NLYLHSFPTRRSSDLMAHKKHYKIADIKESMIKAIDGFVSTLDAHSGFLDPKTYKEMLEMTSGEFFGIGVVIDNMRKKKDKHLTDRKSTRLNSSHSQI